MWFIEFSNEGTPRNKKDAFTNGAFSCTKGKKNTWRSAELKPNSHSNFRGLQFPPKRKDLQKSFLSLDIFTTFFSFISSESASNLRWMSKVSLLVVNKYLIISVKKSFTREEKFSRLLNFLGLKFYICNQERILRKATKFVIFLPCLTIPLTLWLFKQIYFSSNLLSVLTLEMINLYALE